MKLDPKPIFDFVDSLMPGVWNSTGTIKGMNDAINAAMASEQDESDIVTPISDFDRAVIEHLRAEEGVRAKAYQDHLGYWTIGVGRLIDPRKGGRITPEEDAILLASDPSRKGKPWTQYVLTDAEIDMLLLNDVARFVSAMADWPSWQAVGGNVARKVALLSMCFQMGASGLRGFKNSLRMVEQGRFSEAAANFMLSKWAKQTPARAKRVTDMIRTGRL